MHSFIDTAEHYLLILFYLSSLRLIDGEIFLMSVEKSPVHSEVANLRNLFLFNQSLSTETKDQVDFILAKRDEFPYFYFIINHSSQGILTIRKEIDRDQLCRLRRCRCDSSCDLELELFVNRNELTVEILIIRILDRNDHRPEFSAPSQTLSINIVENAPRGAEIKLEPAIDYDYGENGIQDYRLVSNEVLPFSVRFDRIRSDLSLIVEENLDRETISFYEFELVAIDGGNQTGTLKIHVSITDVNDCPPKFDQSIYVLRNVSESISIDSILIRLHAQDNDTGVNGELTYFLLDDEPCFFIDPTTGDVRLRCLLDYEKRTNYRLNFEVRDHGEGSKTDICTLIIELLDENDHAPNIEIYPKNLTIFNESLVVRLSENLPINSLIFSFSIIDEDSGENGRVSWRIDRSSSIPFELIRLTENTGQLRSSEKLDRELRSSFEFNFEAFDHGRPRPKSKILKINIVLLDENDNSPRFDFNKNLQTPISEAVRFEPTIGYEVLRCHAEDFDLAENGEIVYSIETTSEHAKPFRIDSQTGIVRAFQTFDRTKQEFYHLTVRATDKGSPPLFSEAQIVFQIVPANEHKPNCRIENENRSFSVRENAERTTIVANISCFDEDSTLPNREIDVDLQWWPDEEILNRTVPFRLITRYNRLSQEPMEALIVVDGPIDRETIDRYPFVLTVRDQGNPSLSTSFSLSIDVLDENDHCPEFHFDNSFLMINRDLPIDRYVLDLNATDRDLDENGRLTFQLLSSSIFNFGQILPNGTFIVDLNKVSTINESFVVVHFQIRDHGQPVPCKIIESFRLFIGSNQTDWLKVLETQQNRFETDSTSDLTTVPFPIKTFGLRTYSSKYVFSLIPTTKRKHLFLVFVFVSILTSILMIVFVFCYVDRFQKKANGLLTRNSYRIANGKRLAVSSPRHLIGKEDSSSIDYNNIRSVRVQISTSSPCSSINSTIQSNPIQDRTLNSTYTYTAITDHDDYIPMEIDDRRTNSTSDIELMMTTV